MTIHILQDDLINKIAAGEVVDRPAGIVKELVENALDAEADHITVELKNGGIAGISVQDNGKGLSKEQLPLAVKRHATSKISTLSDLYQIQTMGFRGEALASIAAVSKFSFASRTRDSGVEEPGNKVYWEKDQTTPSVVTWHGQCGSKVEANDLFYNIPARKKFLKSATTEYAHCLEFVQAIALSRPEVTFTLMHQNREILHLEKCKKEKINERMASLFPRENLKELVSLEHSNEFGKVTGFISPPGLEKATSKHCYTFLNGRWLKDHTLRYGITRGYHSHLLRGRYPIVALYLEIDPGIVDVNVHPQKTEVRLQYPSEIQELISLAIRKELRQGAWAQPSASVQPSVPVFNPSKSVVEEKIPSDIDMSFSPEKKLINQSVEKKPSLVGGQSLHRSQLSSSKSYDLPSRPPVNSSRAHGKTAVQGGISKESPCPKSSSLSNKRTEVFEDQKPNSPSRLLSKPSLRFEPPKWEESTEPKKEEKNTSLFTNNETLFPQDTKDDQTAIPWDRLEWLGNFSSCYLLFQLKESAKSHQLLVVDQHAFHERVLFERLCKNSSLSKSTQKLLVPEVVTLSASECAVVVGKQEMLKKVGIEFTKINDETIEVTVLPTMLQHRDLDSLFSTIVSQENCKSGEEDKKVLLHDLYSTMACHSAVRAGENINEQDLRQLLGDADGIDFYHNCPHGRRVFRWFSQNSVAKWFDR